VKELLNNLAEELTRQAYKDTENAAELDKFGSRVLANDNRFSAKLKHEIAGTITTVVMGADQDVKQCPRCEMLMTEVDRHREYIKYLKSVLKDES